MERKDWTLLAISFAKNSGLSPVQLQKSLFLLSKNMPDLVASNYYNFIPYNYGPFDQTIYFDAEKLSLEGLIVIEYSKERGWPKYYATPDGEEKAKTITVSKQENKTVEYLSIIVNWITTLSFQQLIRTIYHHYPEYKVNSVFQD